MDAGGIELGHFYRPKGEDCRDVLWLICGIEEPTADYRISMRRSDAQDQKHVGRYSVRYVLENMERMVVAPAGDSAPIDSTPPLERIAACLDRIDQRLERAPDNVLLAIDHYRRNVLGR